MALPKIDTVKYTTIIPSLDKTVEYRPFLVKEEKLFMQAQESEDSGVIIRTLRDVINNCIQDEDVSFDQFTQYDLEWVFLQLRKKSIGENIEIYHTCENPDCGKKIKLNLNLDNVELEDLTQYQLSKDVSIDDKISLKLKQIKINEMIKLESSIKNEDITQSIIPFIDYIYDDENVFRLEDQTKKEINDFVDSLPHKTLMDINEFVSNQPTIKYNMSYICKSCGQQNNVQLKGLSDFFI